jgi:hypothetical protein
MDFSFLIICSGVAGLIIAIGIVISICMYFNASWKHINSCSKDITATVYRYYL